MSKLPTAFVKRKIVWSETKGGAYFSIARRRFIKADILADGKVFLYYLTPGIYLYFAIVKSDWNYVDVSFHKVFPATRDDIEGDKGVFIFKNPDAIPLKIPSDFAKWGFPPKPNIAPYSEQDVKSLLDFVKAHSYWKEETNAVLE